MNHFNLSFHEDDHFNLDHDNRKKVSKNVDRERIAENIFYAGNIPLENFYQQIFQKSYEEYWDKVRHSKNSGRAKNIKSTYLEEVRCKQAEDEEKLQKMRKEGKHLKDQKPAKSCTKVAKQIIVQMGNIDAFDGMSSQEQKNISDRMANALEKYMNTFQKENPNFRIVNAVIHRDEMSLAPHLHLTYVPVAEQKRGQTITNSLSGALKAMGFETDKKGTPGFQTSQMKWQTKERERMIEIAQEFDLETGYQRWHKGKGQSLDEYRATKQLEREVKYNDKVIADQEEEILQNQVEAQEQQNAYDEMAEDLYNTSTALNTKADELEKATAEVDAARKQLEDIDYVKDRLDSTLDKCEKQLVDKLAPPVMPVDDYERTVKGFGAHKKTYVMVPEDEYKTLDARNGLSRVSVTEIVKDLLKPIRRLLDALPMPKSFRKIIKKLKKQVLKLTEKIDKAEKRNAELEKEKQIADYVMYQKLGLSSEVIDIIKAESEREIHGSEGQVALKM